MLGLAIIRKSELKQLKKELREKDGIISNLEVQVKSLTRQRNDKGQFIKK
jgi:hypothetical protein